MTTKNEYETTIRLLTPSFSTPSSLLPAHPLPATPLPALPLPALPSLSILASAQENQINLRQFLSALSMRFHYGNAATYYMTCPQQGQMNTQKINGGLVLECVCWHRD